MEVRLTGKRPLSTLEPSPIPQTPGFVWGFSDTTMGVSWSIPEFLRCPELLPDFTAERLALDALSAAICAHGRELVGLPPL